MLLGGKRGTVRLMDPAVSCNRRWHLGRSRSVYRVGSWCGMERIIWHLLDSERGESLCWNGDDIGSYPRKEFYLDCA